MTPTRPADLQRVIDLTGRAIEARTRAGDGAAGAAARIFGALAGRVGEAGQSAPARLDACNSFAVAVAAAQREPSDSAVLAAALAAIEPQLTWRSRAGATGDFAARHANAMLIGPQGLEQRSDVWLGMSLMSPGTIYPDHRHPPEEIYIVLSQGEWRQEQHPWHEPGIGGLVYNPPDIVHAMQSHEAPLLALWCLWAGDSSP